MVLLVWVWGPPPIRIRVRVRVRVRARGFGFWVLLWQSLEALVVDCIPIGTGFEEHRDDLGTLLRVVARGVERGVAVTIREVRVRLVGGRVRASQCM